MRQAVILFAVLLFGYAGIFALSNVAERNKPATDESYVDEDLYFSTNQLSLLGSDFKGLIADWYWIQSLQYMGGKVVNHKGEVNINDLRPLNPRLVYPMLDQAATLDPQFAAVYSYGAAVLPSIDETQAVKLLEKGVSANPDDWRLYHNLGYIYWQTKNYARAAALYREGASKPGAPEWMRQMSATMQAQGGSRDFARQIYHQMFETGEDEQTKTFAALRYKQIQSLDERDAIRAILNNFRQKTNSCVDSWMDVSRELRAVRLNDKTALKLNQANAPIDPTDVPYSLANDKNQCDVFLSLESKIPNDAR